MRRAWRGGASATPNRGRPAASPRASASTRARTACVGGHGEDQPALAADGVEPEQAPGGVDERPAGGAARQRRGVLDRAADAAPAAARGTLRPVAETSPKVMRSPRPLGSASASTGAPSRSAPAASGSHATAGASPVSTRDDGEVEVRVGAGHAAVLPSARRRT